MNTTNNEQLRKLIEEAGITQVAALALFNQKIGVRKVSENSWRGYFCTPDSKRFRNFSDELLKHANKVFSGMKKQT